MKELERYYTRLPHSIHNLSTRIYRPPLFGGVVVERNNSAEYYTVYAVGLRADNSVVNVLPHLELLGFDNMSWGKALRKIEHFIDNN